MFIIWMLIKSVYDMSSIYLLVGLSLRFLSSKYFDFDLSAFGHNDGTIKSLAALYNSVTCTGNCLKPPNLLEYSLRIHSISFISLYEIRPFKFCFYFVSWILSFKCETWWDAFEHISCDIPSACKLSSSSHSRSSPSRRVLNLFLYLISFGVINTS